jgi:hypothetical protein
MKKFKSAKNLTRAKRMRIIAVSAEQKRETKGIVADEVLDI